MKTLSTTPVTKEVRHANDEIAALLSIIPGLGHIYKGHYEAGLLWMFLGMPFAIWIGIILSLATAGLGLLFLASVFYLHFSISHVYGHHRRAATVEDPASARLGEGLYQFLYRSIVGQFREAWDYEARRRLRAGWSVIGAGNRMVGFLVIEFSILVAIAVASPSALAFVVVNAALAILLLARNERMPSWSELRPVALPLVACGLLWFGAYNVALNAGERRVDAGTAAMLVNVGPILIAILAGFLLHEGFARTLLIGCGIAFGGVVVIALATSNAGVTTAGVVLCILAAVAYSGGVISQKHVLGTLSPLQTILLCCLIGAVACLPFAPQLVGELGDADASAIGWMVYLGVFPTALAFTTWAFALARTGAGRMAATTYLVPPVSVLLGWLVLSESPPALALAGGALCLAGVIVARR